MIKRLLTVSMLLASCPARAGWVNIAEDGASATYGDPTTIERKGDAASLAVLVNYAAPRRLVELAYQSQKRRIEFNCAAAESRVLDTTLHAGAVGEGKVVYEDPSPKDWNAVEPDSAFAKLRALACR